MGRNVATRRRWRRTLAAVTGLGATAVVISVLAASPAPAGPAALAAPATTTPITRSPPSTTSATTSPTPLTTPHVTYTSPTYSRHSSTTYHGYSTATVTTTPTTIAPTTTSTVAPLPGQIKAPPSTLPLTTKRQSGHVSPVFAELSGVGFFAFLVLLGVQAALTRKGRRGRTL